MCKKPRIRLKQLLKPVTMTQAVVAERDGNRWFRADEIAATDGVSTSTIYNRIRENKLEGCTICGIVHARKPTGHGGPKNDEAKPKKSEN